MGQTVQHLKGITGEAKKNGLGKFFWAEGSVYEGEFQDNYIHGEGEYKWNDGRTYKGKWCRIKCTERVACPGKTVVITMVNTFRIRSMERAFSLGRTGEST